MPLTFAAVVVHHRRFPGVLDTVQSVIAAGVPRTAVFVVDNSEDEGIARCLREAADGWHVHTMPNRGYGAAANAALKLIPRADIVLILTHEARLDQDCLGALVQAMTEEPTVGAAGPALLLTPQGKVWSRGGILTRRLLLPRHILKSPATRSASRDVDWLDGACVAYRVAVLSENQFSEEFFLYFEETELHARFRAKGWRVVAVEAARAYQSTDGMPAFWGCRNFVLFQRAHGTHWSRLVGPPWFTVRAMAVCVSQRRWSEIRDAPRGLLAGYRHERHLNA